MKEVNEIGTETHQSRIVLSRLRNGGCHSVASKGFGKTNTKMQLARRFRNEGHRVIIFDTLPNWMHNFDKIPYFTVEEFSVQDFAEQIGIEGYSYFSYNRQYLIASEPIQALNKYRDLLYVVTIQDPDRIGIFISAVLGEIYRQNYLVAFKHGVEAIKHWTVFVIEESENVFDSTSLTKRAFNKIRKQYSEYGNLKIAVVSSSQRLQEVSTKFRSKMDFLIGRTTLDDYQLKVRRLLRHSKYREDVLNLPIGSFLWCPTDSIVKYPLFKQQGKPFDITTEYYKPKPKGFIDKAKTFFGKLIRRFHTSASYHSNQNEVLRGKN